MARLIVVSNRVAIPDQSVPVIGRTRCNLFEKKVSGSKLLHPTHAPPAGSYGLAGK